MKTNVGKVDRILRILIGIALIVVGIIFVKSAWGIAGIVVGVIVLLTGAFGWCLGYRLLGISTCKTVAASKG